MPNVRLALLGGVASLVNAGLVVVSLLFFFLSFDFYWIFLRRTDAEDGAPTFVVFLFSTSFKLWIAYLNWSALHLKRLVLSPYGKKQK